MPDRIPSPIRSRWSLSACVVLLASGAVGVVLIAAPGPPGGAAPVRSAVWVFPDGTSLFRDDFGGVAGAPLGPGWIYATGTNSPGGAAQWGTGEIETASASTANVHQD